MLQGDSILYLDTDPVVYLLPDSRHRLTVGQGDHTSHDHIYINTKKIISDLKRDNNGAITYKGAVSQVRRKFSMKLTCSQNTLELTAEANLTSDAQQRIKTFRLPQSTKTQAADKPLKDSNKHQGGFTRQLSSRCWYSHVETLVHGGPPCVTSQLRDFLRETKADSAHVTISRFFTPERLSRFFFVKG